MGADASEAVSSSGDVDELREALNALSGAVFAHTAVLSILVGDAARHRPTAERITESYFMQHLSEQQDLVSPLARRSALRTFRGFVVDAQQGRREHEVRLRDRELGKRKRSLLRRLIG